MKKHFAAEKVVLTQSCTAAMKIAALALALGPGDEVIVPTFTFCATATAFERTGARIVFCDIDPVTMMLDPKDLERRLTSRTRAVVVVHYGGASAPMETICELAEQHGVHVVEDAAQGFGVTRSDHPLGTFGTFGAFSFHESKAVSCGQGGALLVNSGDRELLSRIDSIAERGTDFALVRSGEKAFYEWTGPGSSFQLGELEAAILLAEFEALHENLAVRRRVGETLLKGLSAMDLPLEVLWSDAQTVSNFHFVGVLAADTDAAEHLLAHLGKHGVDGRRHYVPLHLSPRAHEMGYGPRVLPAAEGAWGRLVRLPVHTGMCERDTERVLATLADWNV
ncbi:aminotransferase class V-fold PLP-dependent enzyme [Nitratireductor sp. GISD-1A_MAKvit]|uniref:aminotransferase class V-fold PLP-dependent enzyme n=1 Tax=Nitratireductor sp. GISD-1A_MAKvit TaxID=3234198 RepID=UPI0034650E59